MIIVDTHAWIWMRSDPGQLPTSVWARLDRSNGIGVSAMSCWEVATLVRRGRIELDRDVESWIVQALTAEPRINAIPVSVDMASRAGALEVGFPGDPVDRIIYSTATLLNCPLITKDDRMRAFAPDRALWT